MCDSVFSPLPSAAALRAELAKNDVLKDLVLFWGPVLADGQEPRGLPQLYFIFLP